MAYLTLSQAIAEAMTTGVRAQVLVGVRQGTINTLLALRSGDSDCTLSVVSGSGYTLRETSIPNRSQSGPDRWDFPISVPILQDRYLLRLSLGPNSRDVPLAAAVQALVLATGWNQGCAEHLTEPLVPLLEFRCALAAVQPEE